MRNTYLAKLRVASDAANLRHEEAKAQRQHADSRILCDKPLTDQIEALMSSPPCAAGSFLVDGRTRSPPSRTLQRPSSPYERWTEALRALGMVTES
jgi:hypothetical protein